MGGPFLLPAPGQRGALQQRREGLAFAQDPGLMGGRRAPRAQWRGLGLTCLREAAGVGRRAGGTRLTLCTFKTGSRDRPTALWVHKYDPS